jgi:hypothetical protein
VITGDSYTTGGGGFDEGCAAGGGIDDAND